MSLQSSSTPAHSDFGIGTYIRSLATRWRPLIA